MKTKNNVQKTILRSAAVVVSFVLISFTVSGQDFWKKLLENSSFNEIALAMVETSKEPTDAKTEADNFHVIGLENDVETSLEMEEWMVNENLFGISAYEIIEEAEIGMEMEEWMLNESLFQVEESGEQALELENWMTSDRVWKI